MGRWAQRRLGNGGGGAGAAPILITEALRTDIPNGIIEVTFSDDVNVADFNAADFTLPIGPLTGAGIVQTDSDTLEVDFAADIQDETDLEYAGTAPNVSTPQTVPLT